MAQALKFMEILESLKLSFSIFLGLKGLNKIKKLKPFRTFLGSSSITFQVVSTKVNFFIFN